MSADRLKRIFSRTVLDPERGSGVTQSDSSLQPDSVALNKPTLVMTPRPHATATPPVRLVVEDQVALPLLGTRPFADQQKILFVGLAVALILLAVLAVRSGVEIGSGVTLVVAVVLALLCAFGLSSIQQKDGRNRRSVAESQMLDAERLQQDARRVNDANQAAILRLMNELQTVAEGDLTQQATVTEDITGAIADSVNYTVEELRTLVASVQTTASRVAQTTSDVDQTSTELLAASNEQMNEIQATGKSVLEMATRINQVSTQAQAQSPTSTTSPSSSSTGMKSPGGTKPRRGWRQRSRASAPVRRLPSPLNCGW